MRAFYWHWKSGFTNPVWIDHYVCPENKRRSKMTDQLINGFASTSGDDHPLNTISFIKGAARTYP